MEKIKKTFYLLLLLFVVLGVAYYFILQKEETLNCAVVLNFKEYNKNYKVTFFYDGKTKEINVPKSKFDKNKIAYNIKLKGIFLFNISPCKELEGTYNSQSKDFIEINGINYKKNNKLNFIIYQNNTPKVVSKKYFIVGNSGYKYIFDYENKINTIIITSPPDLTTVRVGISEDNNSKYYHQNMILSAKRGLNILINGEEVNTTKDDKVQLSFKDNAVEVKVLNKDNVNIKTLFSKNTIKIYGIKNSMILRHKYEKDGYNPTYPGTLEIKPTKEGFLVVNEVYIEDYLKFVVPSEVPISAGLEGYKAQAIAARTYVISDMMLGRFEKYGFHVDDSTLTQVYNSQPTNELVKKAISETENIVMTYNKNIIDAKYYSTSCGFGADYDEVWDEKEKNTRPYLQFSKYTNKEIKNLETPSDALAFFKDWTINAVDSASPYFRWKYTLTSSQLNKNINNKIYDLFKRNPSSFKQKWYFNIYRKANISKEGIGSIYDIYINKHSKSGLVKEMTIVSEYGTYKITGTSTIKKLLVPNEDYKIEKLRGTAIENPPNLPSGFFSIDRDLKSNKITKITIYGGGYGHGVGMSQYGLIESSRVGKSYDFILKTFYKNIEFTKIGDIKIE